jgi:DNA-directed RNA polymerase specialized sigma subunit
MARQSKKFRDTHDPMFSVLAQEIANAIEKNKDGSTQKEQFEELVKAERLFKETMMTYRVSNEMYKKFHQLIRITNNNILSARPYFRESAITFSANITPILKEKDAEPLKKFDINYHFVRFIKDRWIGLWPKKMEMLYQRVERARTILIQNNMPLAVNRAKIFYNKTPKGHLSFLDMVEISSMGLCAGIDKYTGEFKKNFIGVCIGRIVGSLIDCFSETSIHLYPNDRRVLYRANSIRGRQGIKDVVELTKAVNDSFQVDLKEGKTAPKPVTVSELSNLLAAASLVSADANLGEDGYGVYSFTPDSTENAEELLDKNQQISKMSRLASQLPILHQKVLRLKGISI